MHNYHGSRRARVITGFLAYLIFFAELKFPCVGLLWDSDQNTKYFGLDFKTNVRFKLFSMDILYWLVSDYDCSGTGL